MTTRDLRLGDQAKAGGLPKESRELCRVLAGFVFLAISTLAWAADPDAAVDEPEGAGVDASAEDQMVDEAHTAVSLGVIGAAEWFDSFFDTENYFAEVNQSNVRIDGGVFFEQGEAPDFNFKIKGKIDLPRAKQRLNLVFGSEEDEDTSSNGGTVPGDARFNDTTDPAIGLQYFFRESKKQNLSATTGVRFSGGVPKSVFLGPRYRLLIDLDPWLMRFTQRVRWDTDRGWESLTRLDFDRELMDHFLFRVTPQLEWREDKEGYFFDLDLRLFQRLGAESALIYEQNNSFQSEPHYMHEKSDFRLRFRKQWFRKWLFYEVAPRVTFRESDDYDPTLGIELNLEVLFGSKGYWEGQGTVQRDFPDNVPESSGEGFWSH